LHLFSFEQRRKFVCFLTDESLATKSSAVLDPVSHIRPKFEISHSKAIIREEDAENASKSLLGDKRVGTEGARSLRQISKVLLSANGVSILVEVRALDWLTILTLDTDQE